MLSAINNNGAEASREQDHEAVVKISSAPFEKAATVEKSQKENMVNGKLVTRPTKAPAPGAALKLR